MIPSKFYSFSFLFLGFGLVYGATLLTVSIFSENKGEKSGTYFPSVQAQINFYQDRLGTKSYSSSGSSFWSSPEYYNTTFDEARVTLGAETPPTPEVVGKTVTRITRNSH